MAVNVPEEDRMTEHRIRIVLPTRGRKWEAVRAIDSVFSKASGEIPIDIIVCQDSDDEKGRFDVGQGGIFSVAHIVAQRRTFAQWVNFGLWHEGNYTWCAWLGDDVRYLTSNWDKRVVAHSELVVYGPDGYQNENMATHPWMQAALPKALGALIPYNLLHYCADLFVQALGHRLQSIVYDPSIEIVHLHPAADKRKPDQTDVDCSAYWQSDHQGWNGEVVPTIGKLAERIKAHIKKESCPIPSS